MKLKPFKNEVKLIAAVCAQDDVISSTELKTAFEELNKISKISQKDFDSLIDEFFDGKETVEEYFFNCQNSKIPISKLINLCKVAATSDGFALRENYAFLKLCKLADIDSKIFLKDEI